MNAIQKKFGPWAHPAPKSYGTTHTKTCDAQSRLQEIRKSSDREWLRAVIKNRDTQKTVRTAARARLRRVL